MAVLTRISAQRVCSREENMKKIIYAIDSKINLITILFLFWTLFWGLNGFDKFFNNSSQLIKERWASQGFLVDKDKNVPYSIQPSEKDRLVWSQPRREIYQLFPHAASAAVGRDSFTLYFFAVLEIILAALFFWLFLRQFYDREDDLLEGKKNLIADRTIHRLIFKGEHLDFHRFYLGRHSFRRQNRGLGTRHVSGDDDCNLRSMVSHRSVFP